MTMVGAFVSCNGVLASSRCVDGLGYEEGDVAECKSTYRRDDNGYRDPEKPRHWHRCIRIHHRSNRKTADAGISPILHSRAWLQAAAVEPPHARDHAEYGYFEFEDYPLVQR
jgi:hypothetical protein